MGTKPRVPSYPRLVRWWGVGLGALALAAAAFFAVTHSEDAGAAECPAEFTLDFSGLPAGATLGEQYANVGLHISAEANRDHPDALIVFDTNATPTHDPDLAVDIGNIAILAKNVDDENGDGLVDDPDENNFGGKVTFTFDQDVTVRSFLFVDHDHQPSDFVAAYDASGNLITKVLIPVAGGGSVQRIDVNAQGVRRFELVYRDSAGFTGIQVECPQPATPSPVPFSGVVETPTPAPQPQAGGPPVVLEVVQAPAPQPVPQPEQVPSMGGRPSPVEAVFNWPAVALMAVGLVVIVGGAGDWLREMRARA